VISWFGTQWWIVAHVSFFGTKRCHFHQLWKFRHLFCWFIAKQHWHFLLSVGRNSSQLIDVQNAKCLFIMFFISCLCFVDWSEMTSQSSGSRSSVVKMSTKGGIYSSAAFDTKRHLHRASPLHSVSTINKLCVFHTLIKYLGLQV